MNAVVISRREKKGRGNSVGYAGRTGLNGAGKDTGRKKKTGLNAYGAGICTGVMRRHSDGESRTPETH